MEIHILILPHDWSCLIHIKKRQAILSTPIASYFQQNILTKIGALKETYMKTMACPRVNAEVRIDITEGNCISIHGCFDDDACPLENCFAKEKLGARENESYSPSNPTCKFGDRA